MYIIPFLFLLVKSGSCGRILCIFPTPFYSHQSFFQPVWRELSLRGHEVTVITTNPLKNVTLTNLKQIDLSFTYKLVYEDHDMQHVINTESNLLKLMKHVFFIMNNMTSEQLQHPQIRELIKDDDNFDVMIVEAHVPAWFGFAKKYNCPVIVATSMDATNHFKRIIGAINNPVYTPHVNLPFGSDLTFLQRMISVIFEVFDEFQTSYLLYPIQQKIIRQALDEPDLNLFEILKNNVSLMFANAIPGFGKVTMNLPSIIRLNGLQIKPPRPLPEGLQHFLDGASEGAIYFSLGSNIKSYLISEEKKSLLLEAFQELPFKVIWKFEEKVSDLPDNVRVVAWAPQQDILRHNNTKLFVTQGGLQSIEEAIRFKVPILGFPFFGDQFHNVMRVKHLKLGSWLDLSTLTKESFKGVVMETINNDTYLRNLEEISDLLEQPLKPLDKAVWWVEYVIRHKGAEHLRSPLVDIPFYQYYLFDVIIFLVLFSVMVAILRVGDIGSED
ncbi:2-hydroxyacylsphingosine 1-beta-galactosyltransferase-like [Asbolus verrucosus]|uniref:UDP-glucuronosyltransferase n=1 Tax=Asbolus verrucosus TaxID=1661398 RepID=A0A482WBT9_ASBVE|nr:2-hydroxyacylsphingosine 1-beta-galactosyltransferase-like [Asbolus verrucosus]